MRENNLNLILFRDQVVDSHKNPSKSVINQSKLRKLNELPARRAKTVINLSLNDSNGTEKLSRNLKEN